MRGWDFPCSPQSPVSPVDPDQLAPPAGLGLAHLRLPGTTRRPRDTLGRERRATKRRVPLESSTSHGCLQQPPEGTRTGHCTPSPAGHCPAGEAGRGQRCSRRMTQRQDWGTREPSPRDPRQQGGWGGAEGLPPVWGCPWVRGSAEGWEDAQRWGSWSCLPPSPPLSSTHPPAVPQFPLCSVSCPLGRGFPQGRARLRPHCSYREFPRRG